MGSTEELDFFPEDWSTPFTPVLEDEKLKAVWSPFLEVTEERQKDLLDLLEYGDEQSIFNDGPSSSSDEEEDLFQLRPRFNRDPRHCLREVDKEEKKLLKKYRETELVKNLESVLIDFIVHNQIQSSTSVSLNEECFSWSCSMMGAAQRPVMYLDMKSSCHRLIAHSICRYYGLKSTSKILILWFPVFLPSHSEHHLAVSCKKASIRKRKRSSKSQPFRRVCLSRVKESLISWLRNSKRLGRIQLLLSSRKQSSRREKRRQPAGARSKSEPNDLQNDGNRRLLSSQLLCEI